MAGVSSLTIKPYKGKTPNIHKNALVSSLATIIGEGSIIGMGAVVLENTRIPRRSIAVGIPAKVIKPVDITTYSKIKTHAMWYHKLAKSHKGTIF